MLLAYLVSSIVGGTLLLASVLTGHHGAGHGLHHGDPLSHGVGGTFGQIGGMVLSLRFWTYLLAIGGATGLLLHLAANLGEPNALWLALGVGVVSGGAATFVMNRIAAREGESGVVKSREMLYKLGTMLLPAAPGQSSQVRVTINNQTVDLIATTDDSSIAAREEVLILDIKDGVAHVTRNMPAGEKS